MSDKLIAASGLVKRFDGVTALGGVSFGVGVGTIAGVIGPNGAGKSTLLDALSGFQAIDGGSVIVRGTQISGLPAWRIARCGLARTFQDVRVSGSRTVLENVIMSHDAQKGERLRDLWQPKVVASAQHALRQQSLEILESLGLGSVAMSDANAISFGQQKLLSMACCLARTASVYLLDEPLAGLAPGARHVLVDILTGIRRRGGAVIAVEHDVRMLSEFVDRLIVMVSGRVIADGSPESVLARDEIRDSLVGND